MFFVRKAGIAKLVVFNRNLNDFRRPGRPGKQQMEGKRLAEFSVFSVG